MGRLNHATQCFQMSIVAQCFLHIDQNLSRVHLKKQIEVKPRHKPRHSRTSNEEYWA